MTELLVDTSVAVPLLLTSHEAHGSVSGSVGDRSVALAGHALYETYAVLHACRAMRASHRATPSTSCANGSTRPWYWTPGRVELRPPSWPTTTAQAARPTTL